MLRFAKVKDDGGWLDLFSENSDLKILFLNHISLSLTIGKYYNWYRRYNFFQIYRGASIWVKCHSLWHHNEFFATGFQSTHKKYQFLNAYSLEIFLMLQISFVHVLDTLVGGLNEIFFLKLFPKISSFFWQYSFFREPELLGLEILIQIATFWSNSIFAELPST